MPQLQPISAVTFVPPQTGGAGGAGGAGGNDISSRIAPPYDVLDKEPKAALLQRDPHNIVAIDLPVTPPKTVGPDSAYQAAGQTYRDWISSDILQRSGQPAVFVYEQEYQVAGKTLHRRGLFASLKLEEFNEPNGIYRHEMTIQGGIDDRYKLMAATEAQLSPIFGIYSDADASVATQLNQHCQEQPADMVGTTDYDAVVHRVWRVEDKPTIDQLQQFFAKTCVFIADGHHRYTTALKYHRDNPGKAASGGGAGSCLFVLVAAEDPGMIVLPTHRVIHGMTNFTMAKLLELLAGNDQITIEPTTHGPTGLTELEAALPNAGHNAKGLYDPATKQTFILTSRSPDPLATSMPDKPQVWRTLHVAQLHYLLIDQVLRPNFGGDAIGFKYTPDLQQMRKLADATDPNDGRLAVILQPTPLESVMAVSLANEVMPPKSTYFYPKLATGLVIAALD